VADNAKWEPLEITPEHVGGTGTDALLGYFGDTEEINRLLVKEKALVARGFGLTAETLGPVLDLLLPERLPYVHGNSPRTKVGSNLYTSTEYPPEFTISMHNELSYAHQWPSRLAFFCDRRATTGGATPVVDGSVWLDALDPEVRDAYRHGVRYTQNLHSGVGFGRSWQDTFETDRRDDVEAYLAATGATWEWRPHGGIRVSMVRPATIRHPVVGTETWFNQSDQWHTAALDAETAAALTELFPADELPQSVTFADGSPIPPEHVLQVRDRGLASAVDVSWNSGDLMLIDNVLVAHGRRPFTGPRRVLVAMS
jgi:alpha-ketoglutarate-dependent taurine dioxygenase